MGNAEIVVITAAFFAGAIISVAGGGTLLTFPSLLYAGVDPIIANATNTIALLPGHLGGLFSYRKNLKDVRPLIRLLLPVSVLGGAAGAILLVLTPSHTFRELVPFLILFATLMLMFQNRVRRAALEGGRELNAPNMQLVLAYQFVVGIYGGYFGAGIGIMMLAALGRLQLRDIHTANTVKVFLAFVINAAAAVYFIWLNIVSWRWVGLMALSSLAGGYLGAGFAQRLGEETVRTFISVVGLLLALALFLR